MDINQYELICKLRMKDSLLLYDYTRVNGNHTQNVEYSVRTNPDNPIFKGHFPGRPVLPGVMILRLFTLCASDVCGKDLMMQRTVQSKFLNFVDPHVHSELTVHLSISEDEEGYNVGAELKNSTTSFTKAILRLIPAP